MFGERLAAAMKAAGMRVSDVARLCGVSERTMQRWLTADHAPRAAQHLACIVAVTGADFVRLILGEWKMPRPRKYSSRSRQFWRAKRAKFPVPMRSS